MEIKLNNRVIATAKLNNDSYSVSVKTVNKDRSYHIENGVYNIDSKIDMFTGGVTSHVMRLLKRDYSN